MRQSGLLLAISLGIALHGSSIARAGTGPPKAYEVFEDAQLPLDRVAPRAAQNGDWLRMHALSLEFGAMLTGAHPEKRLLFKLRNLQPVLSTLEYLSTGPDSIATLPPITLERNGINISKNGTVGDAHLRSYLARKDITKEAAQKVALLFVDGTMGRGTTYHSFLRALGIDRHSPTVGLRVIGGGKVWDVPNTWSALYAGSGARLFVRDNAEGARLRFEREWEYSAVVPHMTGNSERYHYDGRRWVALAHRQRVYRRSLDRKIKDVAAERRRATAFLGDLRAYLDDPANRQHFAQRQSLWRQVHDHLAKGDWSALGTLVEAQYAHAAAGAAEAFARDVLWLSHMRMIGSGNATGVSDLRVLGGNASVRQVARQVFRAARAHR